MHRKRHCQACGSATRLARAQPLTADPMHRTGNTIRGNWGLS
jgi:hypothetical protein